MASLYPTALDALTNPGPGDSMQSLSHAAQHSDANDAIEAIQAVLGLSPQGGSATVAARCAALESGKASLSGSVSFGGTVGGTGLAGSLLSSASPVMNGTAAAGTGTVPSRQDHVHPSDTSRAALSGATFTGDVVVGKATGTISNSGSGLTRIIASSSDGSARVEARTVSGQSSAFMLSTGSLPRWTVQKGTGAESGSNAGADLQVVAYDDAGAQLSVPVTFARASGKVTFGSVGASAGLEYGTSGPRVMSGTGSPESVVTAPVGSTWIDTAATTGAVEWIKATGTGNTGWKVKYGNTGVRNMSAVSLSNGWTTSEFSLQRVGDIVHLTIGANNSAASADTIYTLPTGFRPVGYIYFAAVTDSSDDLARFYITPSGALVAWPRSAMTGATLYCTATFTTTNVWPSSLPGT